MTPFWELSAPAASPAIIDVATNQIISYGELAALADAQARRLQLDASRRGLVFIYARNDVPSLAAYLGCLRAGHPAALLSPSAPVIRSHAAYTPERLVAPIGTGPFSGYTAVDETVWRRAENVAEPAPLHDALSLLLSTSGSTGSPKLVRLSRENLQSNATAIGEYLGLAASERAPTTLPLSYSYGLSVVNSHLAAGATLLLGEFSVVQQETWRAFATHGATSFAGVPLLYQMLRRLRLDPRLHPKLRTFTQAGGRLDAATKTWFLDQAEPAGVRFVSMYGQTEATARISFVPPECARTKIDSIGRAIPGGELSLDAETGELVYRGPNVMLGYAESRADLAVGDRLQGTLRTGDLGRVDSDGFFYVERRLNRFLKLAGLRVSLDEVERHLETAFGGAVACGGQDERLVVHLENPVPAPEVRTRLQQDFGLANSLVTVHTGTPAARLPNGKIDYAALTHG